VTLRPASREAAIDLLYTARRFRATFGRPPDLRYPRTFNERIACKKLNDRRPLLTRLADKLAVREYVADRAGPACLAELLFVTDDPARFDAVHLPDRFVIKATHGSGCNLIVRDKSRLDRRRTIDLCRRWLGVNFYDVGREWCYRDIPPRILVEEWLGGDDGGVPIDFKFFCFGGVPRFVQVDVQRFTDHRRNIYDPAWNRLPVALHYDNFDWPMPAPETLDAMLDLAATLAAGLDFIRVDLYSVRGQVVFGEMTNYPGNGFERFAPDEYDLVFGDAWPC
jgi:hypothetical protein